jgi:hypothetical protein
MKLIAILAVSLLMFVGWLFKPITHPILTDCETISGTIINISDYGNGDILIRVDESLQSFYINDGQDHGFDPERMADIYVGQQADITYVKHHNLVTRLSKFKHIARLQIGDKIVWNEFDPKP